MSLKIDELDKLRVTDKRELDEFLKGVLDRLVVLVDTCIKDLIMVIWLEHFELICPSKNLEVFALFIFPIKVDQRYDFLVF